MSERRGGRQLQGGGRSNAPGQRGGSQYPYPNTHSLVSRVSAQHRAAGRAASRGRGQTQIQAQPQGHGQALPQVQHIQRGAGFPRQQTNTSLTTTAPPAFPATPLPNPTTTQRVNPLTLRPPTTTPQTQRNLPAAPHTRFVTVTIHTAKCDICNRHNTSILRRCATCGWQICTPCWDARGGDGRHGSRRPFRGDVFNSPDQNQQPSEGASYDNGQRGDTPAVTAQAEADEEVETLQAALILEGMQFARVLRPRQRRNYQEPQLAVPSPIQEETEAENEYATRGDADETESEASQGPGNVVEPNTPAAPASTPSRQLQGPRSAGELGLWYLAEAATEVLERSSAEATDDIEMQDAPPTPTPRGRHTARSTRGRGRGRSRATARLRRGDSSGAKGAQGHKRRRDDHDRGGPSGAAGSAPLV
ncbi:hypothetical protein DTO166G4_7837 [Paecilomyces variotii]|nr:hypothetical protein DTO166G4_7837 [Paecilomyces variotii]KAJ9249505.1 hypothetical protein DTO207G8_6637 [Paecilomyces variotii]KAJ9371467.1 hypothetical protein DTO282E5_3870 [Paecilomyces variotii]KAJ9380246.1 hypothetical protein DTO063F5_6693 [Paecilomyces variotii]